MMIILLSIIIGLAAALRIPEIDTTAALTRAGLFDGDIQLNDAQKRDILNATSNGNERNALNIKSKLWTTKVIPFVFASGFTAQQQSDITTWLQDFGDNTCLKVQPRTDEDDYISIIPNGGGCWSYVGRNGGEQQISLATDGCVYRSTAVHEFMHAAGFWHEQSRADRDDYIQVVLSNVADKMKRNFRLVEMPQARLIGTYDYKSVMQYSSYAFSKNGGKTMILKSDSDASLGQPTYGTLTANDIAKLKDLYSCDEKGSSCTNKTDDADCEEYMGYGYCYAEYVEYMTEYCAKTCGFCSA